MPAYLSEVKRDIEAEHEFIEGMIAQQTQAASGPVVRVCAGALWTCCSALLCSAVSASVSVSLSVSVISSSDDSRACCFSSLQTRELPEDERMELLAALKAKWDTVNQEYQKVTFKNISTSNSTAGTIRRSVIALLSLLVCWERDALLWQGDGVTLATCECGLCAGRRSASGNSTSWRRTSRDSAQRAPSTLLMSSRRCVCVNVCALTVTSYSHSVSATGLRFCASALLETAA